MGVFLDTSVPIKAQRLRITETDLLRKIRSITGEVELATSTIVVTELLHGVYRAKSGEIFRARQEFILELLRDVVVHPYLIATANLAGRIGGEQAALGETIPTVDLMIGAAALSLNFSILTANVRHFTMIPSLHVIPF